jgi:hypothetical protein
MTDLPASLTIPAALIWIATRDFDACLEAFEKREMLQRHPSKPETGNTAVWVPAQNFGLTLVSCVIAKRLRPRDRTIRDKWGTYQISDDGQISLKKKKRDTAAHNFEYADAEWQLRRALREKKITAYTIQSDNSVSEVKAALWLRREFEDEIRKDGHYHVVAAAAGKEPLRDISIKTDEILGEWPPEGGRKRGCKPGRTSIKALVYGMPTELLDSGEVRPDEHGALTRLSEIIAERIRLLGHMHQPDTIRRHIKREVNEWKQKPRKAA